MGLPRPCQRHQELCRGREPHTVLTVLSLALGLPLLLRGINSALPSSSSWVTGLAVGLYQSRGPERGFKKFTISVTEAKELTISQLPSLSIMSHRVRYAESLNLASERTPRHGLSSQELSEGRWHPRRSELGPECQCRCGRSHAERRGQDHGAAGVGVISQTGRSWSSRSCFKEEAGEGLVNSGGVGIRGGELLTVLDQPQRNSVNPPHSQ